MTNQLLYPILNEYSIKKKLMEFLTINFNKIFRRIKPLPSITLAALCGNKGQCHRRRSICNVLGFLTTSPVILN